MSRAQRLTAGARHRHDLEAGYVLQPDLVSHLPHPIHHRTGEAVRVGVEKLDGLFRILLVEGKRRASISRYVQSDPCFIVETESAPEVAAADVTVEALMRSVQERLQNYNQLSRTLGPEFGGALGLVLFLAQSVSIAFYCIGFGEALAAIVPKVMIWETRSRP